VKHQVSERTDMTEIRRAHRPQDLDYILADAFDDGDVETAVAQFEDGWVEWRPPLAGGDQTGDGIGIKELIEQFAGPDTRMDLVVHHVTQANGLALLRSQWQVVRTTDAGEEVLIAHNGIEVVRRQDDGEWRYVIDHPWGADPSWSKDRIPRRGDQAAVGA
jgi:ketosteroid isomerase-like protein